ncbi:hypothetical protein PR048_022659 [Dryococelus australis]|uniref:Uncharacterized protein n=1 Tax=Dryococelus australis TaxID=614101 RepID=A0ABQ9H1L8_9NEOP|nr:hypothetical protein PR048_022659 [Dryococelus australis]
MERSSLGLQGRGKRQILEKTCRPAASCSIISTCKNPVVTPPSIEPASIQALGCTTLANKLASHTMEVDFDKEVYTCLYEEVNTVY